MNRALWLAAGRWVVAFPAALAATLLFNFINMHYLREMFCISLFSSRWGAVVGNTAMGYFDGLLLVGITAAIAPSRNHAVAIVVATAICTMMALVLAWGAVTIGLNADAIAVVAIIVGCVHVSVLVCRDTPEGVRRWI